MDTSYEQYGGCTMVDPHTLAPPEGNYSSSSCNSSPCQSQMEFSSMVSDSAEIRVVRLHRMNPNDNGLRFSEIQRIQKAVYSQKYRQMQIENLKNLEKRNANLKEKRQVKQDYINQLLVRITRMLELKSAGGYPYGTQ